MWQVVQQVLGQAWQQFASQSLAMLPNVIASLLFLVIGVALAVAAGRIAQVPAAAIGRGAQGHPDRPDRLARAGGHPERHGRRWSGWCRSSSPS